MAWLIQLAYPQKWSRLLSAVMNLPLTLQNCPIWHSLGTTTFAVKSEFGVEKNGTCPGYMDCFKLLLPTDVEDVLGRTKVTSCALSWLGKVSQGNWGPLLAVVVHPHLTGLQLFGPWPRNPHLMVISHPVVSQSPTLPFLREVTETGGHPTGPDAYGCHWFSWTLVGLAFNLDIAQRLHFWPWLMIFT